jgi:hypothetical protein
MHSEQPGNVRQVIDRREHQKSESQAWLDHRANPCSFNDSSTIIFIIIQILYKSNSTSLLFSSLLSLLLNMSNPVSNSNATARADHNTSDVNIESKQMSGQTLLGSTKLNDLYEGATKGPGLKYAATAAKVAECERAKHSKEPPSFIPESDTAGLVTGSSRATERQ